MAEGKTVIFNSVKGAVKGKFRIKAIIKIMIYIFENNF